MASCSWTGSSDLSLRPAMKDFGRTIWIGTQRRQTYVPMSARGTHLEPSLSCRQLGSNLY